jgi:hypothetical protein
MQELDTAYRQYEIAQAQVTALESGIVREAESAWAWPNPPTASASAAFSTTSTPSACCVARAAN